MKLEYYNINEFTIYLNNDYMQKIRFDLEDNKEENFRNLLDRLKDIYNLDLYGYYRVIVYINDNYGIIVELYKEDDEYIKIFGESLDLKILFKPESKILYELNSFRKYNIGKYNIYFYSLFFLYPSANFYYFFLQFLFV